MMSILVDTLKDVKNKQLHADATYVKKVTDITNSAFRGFFVKVQMAKVLSEKTAKDQYDAFGK
jgi:hypothetical protein